MDLLLILGLIGTCVMTSIAVHKDYDTNIHNAISAICISAVSITVLCGLGGILYAQGPKLSFTYVNNTIQFPDSLTETALHRNNGTIEYVNNTTMTSVIKHLRVCTMVMKVTYDYMAVPGVTIIVHTDSPCDSKQDPIEFPAVRRALNTFGLDISELNLDNIVDF